MDKELNLRESDPSDSEKLSQFFSQIPLQSLIDIKIQREVDFFSLYRRFQMNFQNFILEETHELNKEILGTASFIHSKCKVGKTPLINILNITNACDLRISPQRKAILHWSKFFLPKIKEVANIKKTDHFITTVNLENNQVINAFIRTKQKKAQKPLYELIKKFNLVSVHGFYPFSNQLNPDVEVRFANKYDIPKLTEYLEKKLADTDLVSNELLKSVDDYVSNSLVYSFKKFIIALDSENNIVGCCYPLSSSLLQNYFPQTYNQQAHNFRQFLKFGSWLGFSRKLTKPFSRTHKDQTLQFQLLHFLFFKHPEVLQNMVHFAYTQSVQNEFIVYTYEQNDFKYRPPVGTVNAETTYGLYEILTTEQIDDSTFVSLKRKIKNKLWLDGHLF